MELTNEQIDAACQALQAMKKPERAVLWMVRDKDGDATDRPTTDEAAAREIHADLNRDGGFKPYTLYRCEPVA